MCGMFESSSPAFTMRLDPSTLTMSTGVRHSIARNPTQKEQLDQLMVRNTLSNGTRNSNERNNMHCNRNGLCGGHHEQFCTQSDDGNFHDEQHIMGFGSEIYASETVLRNKAMNWISQIVTRAWGVRARAEASSSGRQTARE